MGLKSTLEQIKFIERQFNSGKKPREIIQMSDLNERVVRKYLSLLKKMGICFLAGVVPGLGLVGVLVRKFDLQQFGLKSNIRVGAL